MLVVALLVVEFVELLAEAVELTSNAPTVTERAVSRIRLITMTFLLIRFTS